MWRLDPRRRAIPKRAERRLARSPPDVNDACRRAPRARPPSRAQVPGLVAARPLRGRPAPTARRVPPPLRRRFHARRRRQRPLRDAFRPGGRPRGLPWRPGRAPLRRGQRAVHGDRREALGPGARRGPARAAAPRPGPAPEGRADAGLLRRDAAGDAGSRAVVAASTRRSPPCRQCGGSPCGSSSARRWAWPRARRWIASSARWRRSFPTAGSDTPWCS